MTDILERLRGYNPPDRTTHDRRISQDIHDAADEIERLRAARERAERERERLMSLVKEWLDGNARLGRPKSIADQRFLNGLNAAVRLAAPPEGKP